MTMRPEIPAPDSDTASSEPTKGPMPIGERRIRMLGLEAGYRTLTELASAAGVDRHTLVWAARGQRAPRPDVIERIARALRVPVAIVVQVFAMARGDRGSR